MHNNNKYSKILFALQLQLSIKNIVILHIMTEYNCVYADMFVFKRSCKMCNTNTNTNAGTCTNVDRNRNRNRSICNFKEIYLYLTTYVRTYIHTFA